MAELQGTDFYTRLMVEAYKESSIIATPKGFQAFFANAGVSRTVFSKDAETIEIDIERANGERLAATVNRGTSSHPLNIEKNVAGKFTNIARKYPLIEEIGAINSVELLKRLAGEASFNSGLTRFDRLRSKAQDLHIDAIKKIIRTMEFFASKSVLTGQHPSILGTSDANLIYDFHRLATHIFSVAVKWDTGSADIMGDIDTACALIEEDGYMEANFIGLGESAMDAFIKDQDVKELSDNRRYELLEVSTNNPVPPEYARFISAGWIARGRVRTPGGRVVWMFNYNKNYTDPTSGLKVRYLPKDQVFVTDINARSDRYFGPADRLPVTSTEARWVEERFGINIMTPSIPAAIDTAGIILPEMFHFDALESPDHKTALIRTQAAPIFPTIQTDAFVTMTAVM